MEPIALEGGDGARVEMERGHELEIEQGGDRARARDSVLEVRICGDRTRVRDGDLVRAEAGRVHEISFQGPNTDWVTSAAKCCMNIQELSDGQTEERIGERTDGGMALRTDGRMNGGSAASNSKKDIPAGGLTQKDLRAGSLNEGRKNSREEEARVSDFTFLWQ